MALHPSLAAEPSAARTITLAVGASEIVRTRPGVATIILGNPDIADVSLINGTTLTVAGKRAGSTNLILLDDAGGEISRAALQIGPRQTQMVVFGGTKSQNYLCAPGCVTASGGAPLEMAPPAAAPAASEPSPPVASAGVSTEVGGPE